MIVNKLKLENVHKLYLTEGTLDFKKVDTYTYKKMCLS